MCAVIMSGFGIARCPLSTGHKPFLKELSRLTRGPLLKESRKSRFHGILYCVTEAQPRNCGIIDSHKNPYV